MRDLVIKAFTVESGETVFYKEISGNSTEAKPTAGIVDGSIFVETDTGKVFFFNENAGNWVEQFSFQA
jgi:hypothetical protein